MTMTNEQKKLVEQLIASSDEEQIMKIRGEMSWSDSFTNNISEGEVEFYFKRLLVTGHLVGVNRKREAAEKEARIKGQQNSIEGYMTGLLAYVRKQLPGAVVSYLSGSTTAKLEVSGDAMNLHLVLLFDKKEMTINSSFTTPTYFRRAATEDISEWDAGVAGHGQSHRFVAFRREIEEAAKTE